MYIDIIYVGIKITTVVQKSEESNKSLVQIAVLEVNILLILTFLGQFRATLSPG
jgi:hypothetical protein